MIQVVLHIVVTLVAMLLTPIVFNWVRYFFISDNDGVQHEGCNTHVGKNLAIGFGVVAVIVVGVMNSAVSYFI